MIQAYEYLIIGGIIVFQLYIFYIGYRKIQELNDFVPTKNKVDIGKSPLDSGGEVSIIDSPRSGKNFEEVYTSLNQYLINNKGASADFSLMKDIVERNIQKVENSIELLIPLPLYCGLIGTMLGIIIGLFSIPEVSSEAFLKGDGIDILINGVKVAMIASATGLLLTTLNSSYFFRKAKANAEQRKNDFYTFIQTDLLPILSDEVNNSLTRLFQNLKQFNQDFSINMENLDGLMGKNYDTLKSQVQVLDKLESIDLTKLARTNGNLFKRIQNSTEALEKFNGYLQNVNSFVESSNQLSNRLDSLLNRTEDVEKIANHIHVNLEESKELQAFLKSHFSELESRGQLITNSVMRVEDQVDKSLEHLQEFVQNKMQTIKELAIKEEDLIREDLKRRTSILNNLTGLKDIKDELTKNREGQNEQIETVGNRIVDAIEESTTKEENALKEELKQRANILNSLTKLNEIKDELTKGREGQSRELETARDRIVEAIQELTTKEEGILRAELERQTSILDNLTGLKGIKEEIIKNHKTQNEKFEAVGNKIVKAVNNIEIKTSSRKNRVKTFLTKIGLASKNDD